MIDEKLENTQQIVNYNIKIEEENEEPIIDQIKDKGSRIWIDADTMKFHFIRHEDDDIKCLSSSQAIIAISSLLRTDITAKDLRLGLPVIKSVFNPKDKKQYDLSLYDGYINKWTPTQYMTENKKGEFPQITMLLKRLANDKQGSDTRYKWLINWLAYFFQTLDKSQVSLVLVSEQGTGKGIFFENIIAPLFGHSVTIDNDRLTTRFKDWHHEKLFVNLNEAYSGRSSKNTKNFIKQLVTDKNIFTESKMQNAKVTENNTNLLITSNELIPIEVEEDDRRFTVFRTKGSLKRSGIKPKELIHDIQNELEAFAYYLDNYEADRELYDTPLSTKEKDLILKAINGDSDTFNFVYAIEKGNIDYFENLSDELYSAIKMRFNNHKHNNREKISDYCFSSKELISIYNGIFNASYSPRAVLSRLRGVSDNFARKNIKQSAGLDYYLPKYDF